MLNLMLFPIVAVCATATPWNELPGLVPKHGAWRGSTAQDADLFDSLPLHIYRVFKWPGNSDFTSEESAFINKGGIIFYSVQPTNWTEAALGKLDPWIEAYAQAIRAVAPAMVMMAPGYEPDGHAADGGINKNKIYGKASEYQAMYKRFVEVFEKQTVNNVVWIMDWSMKIIHPESQAVDMVGKLWPGDVVQWNFFNVFQSEVQHNQGNGNCSFMLESAYNMFHHKQYQGIPWGLGAWSTMNETWSLKTIPTDDRVLCLQQIQVAFDASDAATKYPKLKASIYFNSLNSVLDTAVDNKTLISAFQAFQHARRFKLNDHGSSFLAPEAIV